MINNILALETSQAQCSVALCVGGVVSSRVENVSSQRSRHVLSMIDGVMRDLAFSPTHLDALTWSAGPGSFTGLRVGASVCQALAYVWQLPIIPLSSLLICAQTAVMRSKCCDVQHIAVALDARMGGVYWASFVWRDGRLARIDNDQLLSAKSDVIRARLCPQHSWIGVGDAWELPALQAVRDDVQICSMGVAGDDVLSVTTLPLLARQQLVSTWVFNPVECVPLYVSDATQWKKRQRLFNLS